MASDGSLDCILQPFGNILSIVSHLGNVTTQTVRFLGDLAFFFWPAFVCGQRVRGYGMKGLSRGTGSLFIYRNENLQLVPCGSQSIL